MSNGQNAQNAQQGRPDVVIMPGQGQFQGMMLPEAGELLSTVDTFARRIPWWVWFIGGALVLRWFNGRKGS